MIRTFLTKTLLSVLGFVFLLALVAAPASAQLQIKSEDVTLKFGFQGQFWTDWTQDATAASAGPQGYAQNFYLLRARLMLGGSVGILGFRSVLPRFQAGPRSGVLPIAALVAYALAFGLAVTGISAAFGVGTDASVVDRVLVFSFISLAVTASTAAMVSLIGAAGAAVTGTLFFVIGAQISGGNTAFEFLSPFWSGLGEHLPGGAGTALLRDVLYFPDASMTEPIATLAAYVGAGVLVVLGLSALRSRLPERRPRLGSDALAPNPAG